MNWMIRWPGDHPVYVDRAEGAWFWDVDGNAFVDFCLGDTGGMAGHAPKVAVDAIAEQAGEGITLMLPTEDAAWVGTEMARRFRRAVLAVLPYRDRREPVRDPLGAARSPAARRSWCTTGATTVRWTRRSPSSTRRVTLLDQPGNSRASRCRCDTTTQVVEINDLEGLERELAEGDVAACLFEPALTNIGIVLPDPGLPRGRPRALHQLRHASADRRDPHDQRGAGRLHEGLEPRSRTS